jgi:hypothetical protein
MTILRTLIFLCLTLCSATMAHAEPLASDKNLIVDPPVPSSGDRVGVTAYYYSDGPLVPKSVRYEGGTILIDYAIKDGYIFIELVPILRPEYSTAWLPPLPPGEYEIRTTLQGYAFDTATQKRVDYSYPPRRITVSPAEEDAVIDAVEYYHAGLDHYFLSAAQAEIALIDADRFPGWARTGRSFRVFAAARPERAPVCRYYIPPGKGDSHFFGVATIDSPTPFWGDECRDIELATFAGSGALHGLVKETANAFYVLQPERTTGACPAGSRPVYRLWNQRSDSNHRYTTDLAVRAEMLARGYVSEGYGLLGVVMCVPE